MQLKNLQLLFANPALAQLAVGLVTQYQTVKKKCKILLHFSGFYPNLGKTFAQICPNNDHLQVE